MKTAFAASALAAIGSAAAFVAPSSFAGTALKAAPVATGPLRMAVEDLIGADTETGGIWDPLGFAKDEKSLYKYREAELKHGRVAQLAILGVLAQTFFHLPDPVFAGGARPQEALASLIKERPEAIAQIFLAVGVVELFLLKQDPEKAPGDLGFGIYPDTQEELEELQLKELKNGRLAQVAIVGAFVQEKLTGQGPIEQLLAGHTSPFGDGQGAF
ncbi:light harvesting complex protein [Tribonema minus]|uniref:Light harvesting complex protein n=1 Tax=Tribonema minus TaxID=303371 RepID=A0A835ZHX7_9STRA|nr:light harvesting complex protein [Tribonema minus]